MNRAKLATIYENVTDTRHTGQVSLLIPTQVSPRFITRNVTLQNCIPGTGAPCPRKCFEPAHVPYPVIAICNPSETTSTYVSYDGITSPKV
jgi:hypothetical protein